MLVRIMARDCNVCIVLNTFCFVGSGSGLRRTTDLVTRLKGGRSMCSMKQLDKALRDHIVDFGALFLAVARLAAIFGG